MKKRGEAEKEKEEAEKEEVENGGEAKFLKSKREKGRRRT